VNAPKGSYELSVVTADQPNAQNVTNFEIPVAGQKAMTLEHLPPVSAIKSFSLAAR